MKIKEAEVHDRWTINTTRIWSKETKSKLKKDIQQAFATPQHCAKNRTISTSDVGFIHIPKTGGESMEAFLGVQKSHEIGSTRISNDPSKVYFSTVRDPYTRMESWFRFCLHGYRNKVPTTHKNKQNRICQTARSLTAHVQTMDQMKIAFEEFLQFVLIDARDLWVTATTTRYLVSDNGQLIPTFLIRFEDLAEETKRVVECGLGIHQGNGTNTTTTTAGATTDSIQHLNGSGNNATDYKSNFPILTDMLSSKDAAFWYTDRSWCMIQWAFEVDIKLFGSHNRKWLYHQRSPCHIVSNFFP